MKTKQLSLYNSKITIRLNTKEKQTLKTNAFKRKLTMSEYIRQLIIIDNRSTFICDNLKNNDKALLDIGYAKNRIGRDD